MVNILLLVASLFNIMPQPNIALFPDKEHLKVEFDYGAKYMCTTFEQQESVFKKMLRVKPYSPRHCWYLSGEEGSLDENWNWIPTYNTKWKVWSEIQYPKQDGSVLTKKTNVLEITR